MRAGVWQGIDLPVFHSCGGCLIVLPSGFMLFSSSIEGQFQRFFWISIFSFNRETATCLCLSFFPSRWRILSTDFSLSRGFVSFSCSRIWEGRLQAEAVITVKLPLGGESDTLLCPFTKLSLSGESFLLKQTNKKTPTTATICRIPK